MRKYLGFIFIIFAAFLLLACEKTVYTVTFNVNLPSGTPDGDIYIVGDLKHPEVSESQLDAETRKATREGLTATYTLVYEADDLPLEIEYKWTRGSWETVEMDADGEEIENRKVSFTTDKRTYTINDTVATWADDEEDEVPSELAKVVEFDFQESDLGFSYSSNDNVNKVIENIVNNTNINVFVTRTVRNLNHSTYKDPFLLMSASTKGEQENFAFIEFNLLNIINKMTFKAAYWSDFDANEVTKLEVQELQDDEWVVIFDVKEALDGALEYKDIEVTGLNNNKIRLYAEGAELSESAGNNGARVLFDDMVFWGESDEISAPEKFTVTFNTDGGSEIPAVEVEEGLKVTKPTNPTKAGYIFKEWQLDGETFDFETLITENITLVAVWEEDDTLEPDPDEVTVTVLYEGSTTTMDGSANNAELLALDPSVFEVLSTARQLPNSQQVGLNQSGQIRLYGHASYISKNTLTILIAEGYVITNVEIKFLAGSNNPSSATLMLGDNEVALTTEDIVDVTKTYDDLSIDGFSIRNSQDGGSGNSQIYIDSIVITYKEGTATSEFTPIPVLLVTFDLNYVDSPELTRSFEPNDEFTMPSNPTRLGYTFDGWFTDQGTTTPFESEDVETVTEEFTVFAKWEILPDDDLLALAKNGLDVNPLTFTEDGTIELPLEGLFATEISWGSSNETAINPLTGVVTLPEDEGETVVILTATLTLNEATDTKLFEISLIVTPDAGEQLSFTETFDNMTMSGSSYGSGSHIGINGQEWFYDDARGDHEVDGKALLLRNGSLKTTLPNGLSKLSFDYIRAFTSSNPRTYEIYINSELIDTIEVLATADERKTYSGEFLPVSGVVELEIKGIGAQKLIDNVKWTEYVVSFTNQEKLDLAGTALFDELNNKAFDMGTPANLPTEGLHGVTVTWTFDPADSIVDGLWKDVTEDTNVTLTATLSIGEDTLEKVMEITIVFINPDVVIVVELTESSIWDSKTNSYKDGNFNKDFSGLTVVATDDGIYTGNNYGDDKIQVRRNYNWIHNTEIPEGYVIKTIKVNGISSSGTIDISYSTSSTKPTENTITLTQTNSNFDTGDISGNDYKYFYIKGNNDMSGTITIDSIIIELVKK